MVKKQYTTREVKRFVRDFIVYLKTEQHMPVRSAYLFGSYARGNPRDWSDIDVAIVSPKLKREGTFTYLGIQRRDIDVIRGISPIGYHPSDFRSDDVLVREIQKTGVKVSV